MLMLETYMQFEDRGDAGNRLGKRLGKMPVHKPLVLALPRGGVPVGYEISQKLHIPLEVLVSRKIGSPNNIEFGIGAVAENDVVIADRMTMKAMGITQGLLNQLIKAERVELLRRIKMYREGRKLPSLTGRTAILVDDGLATGVTMRAAVKAVNRLNPKEIVVAIPVCAHESAAEIEHLVTVLLCLTEPYDLRAIGNYYRHFEPIKDDEVVTLLERARKKIN